MSNKPVAESLKIVLADTYSLYLKTQNYHWNVTGPHFKSLHMLFEEQYNDLFTAVDVIAERIRTLGEKAPGTFSAYQKVSSIKEGNEKADAQTMVKELAEDQGKIITTLTETLQAAQNAGDEGTIGIIVDRISVHEKNAWMLKSSL